MVDTSAKLDAIIRDYVEQSEYFTLNYARQYGKTTTLELLYQRLKDEYLVIDLSFEGKDEYFASLEVFSRGLAQDIKARLAVEAPDLAGIFALPPEPDLPLRDLAERIAALCRQAPKEVILIIDEVDKAADHIVFLTFLGLLRDKYIERQRGRGKSATFQSVILAGVHDIKNLKMKLHPEVGLSYNSPWNIAARFDIDMSFSAMEIATMLNEYEADMHTGMRIAEVAARLFYFTSGYPFLVSRLCKTMAETPLAWTVKGVDAAENLLQRENNTLFDDVIKNIVNHPTFATLLRDLLLHGIQVTFESRHPDIDLGVMYGILKEREGKVCVANVTFETIIYNYFTSLEETRGMVSGYTEEKDLFIRAGKLDVATVLDRFAAFMLAEYRAEDGTFIEQHARLLFLSFLKPIINGYGHYAVEPETRGSRRMDVVVFFGGEEHIIELKIWRGEQAAAAAYDQLAGYLRSQGQKRGYLLSFVNNLKAPREGRILTHNGCEIVEVVVAYRDKN
jgi:hypothetical protein